MTFARFPALAYRTANIVRHVSTDQIHDANDEKTNMSNTGLQGASSISLLNNEIPATPSNISCRRDISTQTVDDASSPPRQCVLQKPKNQNPDHEVPSRISFTHLVDQLRREISYSNRSRLLSGRKKVLRKSIALSERLHRLSAFVRDGLVEISKHSDVMAFKRAQQHMQHLVDVGYSRWNIDLHALDSLERNDTTPAGPVATTTFFAKLSSNSQRDLLAFVKCLRSDAEYLLTRLKSLPHAQLTGLRVCPRFSNAPDEILSSKPKFIHNQRAQRVQNFSKQLEKFASSFERSDPWSFLFYNCFGAETCLSGPEHQLRLSTWSTVLVDLMTSRRDAYVALFFRLFDSFASLQEWKAKASIENFLMDLLQRGAFLLLQSDKDSETAYRSFNNSNTKDAQDFFNLATLDLFGIFAKCGETFPVGALQLASAVLAKLPTEELQSIFRGDFFVSWFLGHYLGTLLVHPETENLLLNFHVDEKIRRKILGPLSYEIRMNYQHQRNGQFPYPACGHYIYEMLETLVPADFDNPYKSSSHLEPEGCKISSIVICPTEIVKVLEALSPQVTHHRQIPFAALSTELAPYSSHKVDRFSRLKEDLLSICEPGSSSRDTHPYDEQWLELEISKQGDLVPLAVTAESNPVPLANDDYHHDKVQQAIHHWCKDYITCTEGSTCYRAGIAQVRSVKALFQDKIMTTIAQVDPVARFYWEDALNTLAIKYPRSHWEKDDSAVLRSLVDDSMKRQSRLKALHSKLEDDTMYLEEVSAKIKRELSDIMERCNDLKVKMWYSVHVVNSLEYEYAKNITSALNNMALSTLQNSISSSASIYSRTRPQSSQSTTSSILGQPLAHTLSILKAPREHGGPKKLSDDQIKFTTKWLKEGVIDNFCEGEERIHRFCMEISNTAKTLVGESMLEGRVLWASELFDRERNYFDIHMPSVASAPASTRAASVASEAVASTAAPIIDGTRIFAPDDFRSPLRRTSTLNSGSTRYDRDQAHQDSLLLGSPGRTYSFTTGESVSTLWSPPPSNAKSMTSASIHSRPTSTYTDYNPSRLTDTSREKTRFLEKIRQRLICLLLSDLGSTVWGRGSETDSWIQQSGDDPEIWKRLHRRFTMEHLLGSHDEGRAQNLKHKSTNRSASAFAGSESMTTSHNARDIGPGDFVPDAYMVALEDLLLKLGATMDPKAKLQVVEEFYKLTIAQLLDSNEHALSKEESKLSVAEASTVSRRNSVGNQQELHMMHQSCVAATVKRVTMPTEQEIHHQIRLNLIHLKPASLFRDLQYIAAFLPKELANGCDGGKALYSLGLAALLYKREVCCSMVEVAERLIARDGIDRHQFVDPPDMTVKQAIGFWQIAAREGNAIAQRELALLYLSHPQLVEIVTYPLSLSSETFKHDMMWQARSETNSSTSSLCLALHWMRLAERGGDQVAREKLQERQTRNSFQ